MTVLVTGVLILIIGVAVMWNPKVDRDGRFMRVCHWVSRRYVKISWLLMLLMLQTVFFLVWQTGKEIQKRDQQIEQLKKKCGGTRGSHRGDAGGR